MGLVPALGQILEAILRSPVPVPGRSDAIAAGPGGATLRHELDCFDARARPMWTIAALGAVSRDPGCRYASPRAARR